METQVSSPERELSSAPGALPSVLANRDGYFTVGTHVSAVPDAVPAETPVSSPERELLSVPGALPSAPATCNNYFTIGTPVSVIPTAIPVAEVAPTIASALEPIPSSPIMVPVIPAVNIVPTMNITALWTQLTPRLS